MNTLEVIVDSLHDAFDPTRMLGKNIGFTFMGLSSDSCNRGDQSLSGAPTAVSADPPTTRAQPSSSSLAASQRQKSTQRRKASIGNPNASSKSLRSAASKNWVKRGCPPPPRPAFLNKDNRHSPYSYRYQHDQYCSNSDDELEELRSSIDNRPPSTVYLDSMGDIHTKRSLAQNDEEDSRESLSFAGMMETQISLKTVNVLRNDSSDDVDDVSKSTNSLKLAESSDKYSSFGTKKQRSYHGSTRQRQHNQSDGTNTSPNGVSPSTDDANSCNPSRLDEALINHSIFMISMLEKLRCELEDARAETAALLDELEMADVDIPIPVAVGM